jgi:hypothetical protein
VNSLKKIFNYAYLVTFYVVSVIAITTVIKDCFIAGVLAFPVMLFVIYLLLKRNRTQPRNPKKYLWPILQLISTGVMLCFAFVLAVKFSWDWGDLIRTAYEIATGQEISWLEYYARYPNNRFWLTVLTGLFKVVVFFSKEPSIVVCKVVTVFCSVTFVQLTIFLIYKTAQKIWDAEKALIVGCAALLFLPFYLYSQFAYTDTPSMLLIVCMACVYIQYRQSDDSKLKHYLLFAVIGVLSALIYQIKIMGLIVTIAIMIDSCLSLNDLQKAKKGLISLVAFGLAFVCCMGVTNVMANRTIPISEELSQKYEFPFTHWVMMGLGKSGGYNQADVDYSISFGSYDEKVEGNIAEIKNRLSERGVHGTAKHLLVTKVARTWGNDHFAGADYVHRKPVYPGTWMHDIFTLDGEKGFVRDIYTGIYHIAMLLGILLACVFALKNKHDDPLLFARIALFGMTIFMIIWECNSRYLMTFAPLLLLCSCDGWFKGIGYSRKKLLLGVK